MKTIKLLSARIAALQRAINKIEKWEPQMLSDWNVSEIEIQNCKIEILELQKAIKILNENL
jgi:hypothetical protein